MTRSMAPQPERTRQKNGRTDSERVGADRFAALPVRTVSEPLRIDPKVETLSAINETRTRLGRSVECMAELAGVPVSQMSEALSGTRGNFAAHWLTAQGLEFEDVYNAVVRERRGHTPEDIKARKAQALGELVRRFAEAM